MMLHLSAQKTENLSLCAVHHLKSQKQNLVLKSMKIASELNNKGCFVRASFSSSILMLRWVQQSDEHSE